MITNIKGAIATRAAQIATSELKQKLRGLGLTEARKRISDLPTAIAGHLSEHPRILERARADVEQWRKNRVPKR